MSGESAYADELNWLRQHVYGERAARVEVEIVGATVRYSLREGQKEMVNLA